MKSNTLVLEEHNEEEDENEDHLSIEYLTFIFQGMLKHYED